MVESAGSVSSELRGHRLLVIALLDWTDYVTPIYHTRGSDSDLTQQSLPLRTPLTNATALWPVLPDPGGGEGAAVQRIDG